MEVPVAVAGWANHAGTFMSLIESYKTKELFCDCTLACDRKLFRAHKMILAMSSELFEKIFMTTEDKNPVIILHDIEAWQVECLLNYMYKGETRVSDTHFIPLCRVAKSLQIKGFDKLELYREAVKQSGKKDSRLITKTEEGRNENFYSLRQQTDGEKSSVFRSTGQVTIEKETKNVSSHQGSPDRGANFPVPITPTSQAVAESRNGAACTRFPSPKHEILPTLSPIEKDNFGEGTHEKSPSSSQQKIDDSVGGSFSERFNYHTSPTFNFKKNYLLSASHTHHNPKLTPHPASPTSYKGGEGRSSSPGDGLDDNHNQKDTHRILQRSDAGYGLHDVIRQDEIKPQKTLREPPPLLRISYDDPRPDDKPIKMEHDSPVNPYPPPVSEPSYDSHPRPDGLTPNQQWFDNFLHLTLASEPGNDPLLQKIPTNKRKRVRGPKSWEFLLRLLRSPESNPSLIKWENEEAGVFRLIRPEVIALRWGRRTGKHVHDILSYESFSRGLRYHYATGALCAVSEKSFVYQFGPKAEHALRESKEMIRN